MIDLHAASEYNNFQQRLININDLHAASERLFTSSALAL
jgi:hypothetical protein